MRAAARDTIVICMDLRGKQMGSGAPTDAAEFAQAVELFVGEMRTVGKRGW